MGKKYVIEVADNYFCDDLGTKYWRIKGVDGFILDEDDLSNLEEYKEPVTHEFKVGDVCHMTYASKEGNLVLTYIDNHVVNYIWGDGQVGSTFINNFKKWAKFIYHSDSLEDFFGGIS